VQVVVGYVTPLPWLPTLQVPVMSPHPVTPGVAAWACGQDMLTSRAGPTCTSSQPTMYNSSTSNSPWAPVAAPAAGSAAGGSTSGSTSSSSCFVGHLPWLAAGTPSSRPLQQQPGVPTSPVPPKTPEVPTSGWAVTAAETTATAQSRSLQAARQLQGECVARRSSTVLSDSTAAVTGSYSTRAQPSVGPRPSQWGCNKPQQQASL
jgi:hypothetical protein